MTESGFLVLAQVSGFPVFVSATESEHGPRITATLRDAVADHLAPLLRLEKREGNAVFATLADRVLATPALLLDVVEQAFVAFRTLQREIHVGTGCPCNACGSIPSLDASFVIHHGSWLRRTTDGGPQCSGSDVDIAHHLLHGSVQGLRSHVLVSEAALTRMGVDARRAGMQPHEEAHPQGGKLKSHAYGGEVKAAVADLEPVWQRAQQPPVRVYAQDALVTLEAWLPIPPHVAWDWMIAPDRRGLWEEMEMVESEARADRRLGVGTRYHCHFGRSETATFEIVEWRPFRYFTWDNPVQGVPVRGTTELHPDGGGTRVINFIGVSPEAGLLQRARARFKTLRRVERKRAAAFRRLRMLLDGERSLHRYQDAIVK